MCAARIVDCCYTIIFHYGICCTVIYEFLCTGMECLFCFQTEFKCLHCFCTVTSVCIKCIKGSQRDILCTADGVCLTVLYNLVFHTIGSKHFCFCLCRSFKIRSEFRGKHTTDNFLNIKHLCKVHRRCNIFHLTDGKEILTIGSPVILHITGFKDTLTFVFRKNKCRTNRILQFFAFLYYITKLIIVNCPCVILLNLFFRLENLTFFIR